jgi:hypothetical protein
MEYCYSSGLVTGKQNSKGPGMAGCHETGETLFPDSRLNQLYIEKNTGTDEWNEALPAIIDWGSLFDNKDKSNHSTYGSFNIGKDGVWNITEGVNDGYPYLNNTPL